MDAAGYITAFLFPIVRVVIGVMLIGRQNQHGRWIIALSVLFWWPSCWSATWTSRARMSASPAATRPMWLSLVAMTLASSMILVDQTAVPLASPDVVLDLTGSLNGGQWILTANILPLAAFWCSVVGSPMSSVSGASS